MRRRWQRLAVWAIIGLIPAVGAGLPVWAQGEEPAPGQEQGQTPGLEQGQTPEEPGLGDEMFLEGLTTEPGTTAPAFEPSAPAFSAPAVPEGQAQYRLHRVGKEENLHLLAAYYYGDARQWNKIYQLNQKKIKNPNVIQEGQILKIDVPPGWQPRFSLPEFMDKERKRIAQQGLPKEEKPKIIREKEEVQLIPSLLPVEEEEAGKEEKGEKKEMLTPPIGGVPGVPAPPPSPTPPEGPGEGAGGGETGGGTGGTE